MAKNTGVPTKQGTVVGGQFGTISGGVFTSSSTGLSQSVAPSKNIRTIYPSYGGGGGSSSGGVSVSPLASVTDLSSKEKASLQFVANQRLNQQLGGKGLTTREYRRRLEAYGGNISALRSARSRGYDVVIPKSSDKRLPQNTTLLINPNTGRPYGVISAVQKERGLGRVSQLISQKRGVLITKKERETSKNKDKFIKRLGREGALVGLTVASSGVNAVRGFAQAPKTVVQLVKNPKMIKEIPKNIALGAEEYGKLLKTSPYEGLAKIGTEIFILKGTGKALKLTGKVTGKVADKISPNFAKIKSGRIVLTKSGKTVNLNVVKRIPTESISSQIRKGGRVVPVAVSSQQQKLLTLINRNKMIRKPIPNENLLPKLVKKQLKRFDKGQLNRKQIYQLDRAIKKSGKAKGLLERSFFVDPSGKIRPSRLGIAKDKTLKLSDYFSEDITLRQPKPQILMFRNIKVQNFPKGFGNIKKKLSSGGTLSKKESSKLLNFQLKRSGKFKPLGFVTKESELTLAPGEIVKRAGKPLAYTRIYGKKVRIIDTKVGSASKKLDNLLKKANQGKLNKREFNTLKKTIKKETGFKAKGSYSPKSKVYLNLKRVGTSLGLRLSSKIKKSGVISSKTMYRPSGTSKGKSSGIYKSTYKGKITSSYRTTPSRTYKSKYTPSYKTTPRYSSSYRPTVITPIKPVLFRGKKLKYGKKVLSGKKLGFNVYAKSKGKIIKLNKKPLTERDAKDRLAYAVDHSTAVTVYKKPVMKVKKFGKIKSFERGAYTKASNYLREYKIRKGKRIPLRYTYIEKKGRPRINTGGEKRGLSIARLNKQLNGSGSFSSYRKPVRIVRRRITPARRKVLISQLKKARAVRMRNLRRR